MEMLVAVEVNGNSKTGRCNNSRKLFTQYDLQSKRNVRNRKAVSIFYALHLDAYLLLHLISPYVSN